VRFWCSLRLAALASPGARHTEGTMNHASRVTLAAALLWSGCGHKAMHDDSAGDHTAHGADGADGSDGGAAGDGGAAADACGGLVTGRATTSGSCFGMEMQADLALDAATCAYTLSNWSMDHGEMPSGGQVVDGVATLEGGGFSGCTGEAAGGHVEGLCADGCSWVIDVG
jgi:hypothetical protein